MDKLEPITIDAEEFAERANGEIIYNEGNKPLAIYLSIPCTWFNPATSYSNEYENVFFTMYRIEIRDDGTIRIGWDYSNALVDEVGIGWEMVGELEVYHDRSKRGFYERNTYEPKPDNPEPTELVFLSMLLSRLGYITEAQEYRL